MAKYELKDEQIKSLMLIINDAVFKGKDSELITALKKAISTPIAADKNQDKEEKQP